MNELIAKDHPEFQGLILVHALFTLYTMLLEKVLNNMGKTLLSCVQIFTLFSSIVLPDSARSPKSAQYKSVHDVKNQRERCNQSYS